ncbi:hypothetical protein [Corynebacterium incognita]|nr:hypothetical protein [Corynebacterium incognita]
MKLSHGRLEVAGETKPARIRRTVAVAGIDAIDALDRDVRVRTVLTEHRGWSRPWLSWTSRVDEDYYEALCADVFGHRPLPPLDAYVAQLSSLDRILLRIALALRPATGSEIKLLIMDDLDQVRESADRAALLDTLVRLAERFPVVINSVNPLPAESAPPHQSIELFTDHHHLQPEPKDSDQ